MVNGHAAEQLLPLVYEELRNLAAAKMAQEKPGQTLQATALVHEAYIRLVDTDKQALEQPRPFLCCGCRSHAADSGGAGPPQGVVAGRWGGCSESKSMRVEPTLEPSVDLLALTKHWRSWNGQSLARRNW